MMAEIETVRAQLDALTKQVAWLLDREAIRNVKQLYCRLADNGRYDEWEKLFTEDFTCQINGPPMADGSAPSRLDFPTRQAWIEFARTSGAIRAEIDARGVGPSDGDEGNAPGTSRIPGTSGWNAGAGHHMHGGEIEFTGPDCARAIWPSQFDFVNGYYDEEYRREGGVWKIARERFYAQARREYSKSDYPYEIELGVAPEGSRYDCIGYHP